MGKGEQKHEVKEIKAEPAELEGAIEIKDSFKQLKQVQEQFTEKQIEFVMKSVAPSLNKDETWLFLLKCQLVGMNPLNGEIFAYSSTRDSRRQLVIIAGRDGKRNRAERTGQLEYKVVSPIYTKEQVIITEQLDEKGQPKKVMEKVTIQVKPWEGTLWGAECTVKRLDKKEATFVRVPLSEYKQSKAVWTEKPETMIKKVAESQALSEAFPILAGIYDEAEAFGEVTQAETPILEDGGKPASPEMMATLKALGAEEKPYTAQEAANEVIRLNNLKRKPKKEPAK
jgi:phage recombination protein Bet